MAAQPPLRLLCLQGPNLNLLGTREPEVYGSDSLVDVQARLDHLAVELGCSLVHFQSNHEGALVDRVQQAAVDGVDGCLINPGAYGHTSIALRDAFVGTGLPFVEIHVSNVYAREPFRHRSMLADVARGVVVGLGVVGYEVALRGLAAALRKND